jgi:uncharacterized protein (DUF849 family)
MDVPIGPLPALIINVAMTGAVPTPERYPALPVTPAQIAADAAKCAAAGASVVHVHVRDDDGRPVHDRARYEATYAAIREEAPDLLVCGTTTSRGGATLESRLAGFDVEADLRPEFASLSLGSFNFPSAVSCNPLDEIVALLERMGELGVRPEFEVFELGMIATLHRLIERGLVVGPPVVNILLGNPGSAPAHFGDLATMVERLPDGTEWAVAGIGRYQRSLTIAGALMGGNVRTGLEDHPRGDGSDGWTNADAVAFTVEAGHFVGRKVATPTEARVRFGLAAR